MRLFKQKISSMHPLFHKTMNSLFYRWCSIQNRSPLKSIDQKLRIKKFTPTVDHSEKHFSGSPSRVLSNLFWEQLPWDQLITQLTALTIFDTGCGSGWYGSYLDQCSGQRVEHYKGIDVNEHADWQQRQTNPKFSFEKYNGKHITPLIPSQTNFFMSQSAIEHFVNDKQYFEEIREFITNNPSRPIVQVHLFPSAACMKLYGRHGYRQYTPRTISKITKLFSDSECILLGLGGPQCTRVHTEYITTPLETMGIDFRKTKEQEYQQALRQAIQIDHNDANSITDPSFWALVICSHWNQPFSL